MRPADGMIRVFFHEPCRSSKQWPRSFFAITRCGKTRSIAVSQIASHKVRKGHKGMTENEIAKQILDAAFVVHTKLGPGLLESVYEVVLAYELKKRGLTAERQKPMPICCDNIRFDEAFRSDLVVNWKSHCRIEIC